MADEEKSGNAYYSPSTTAAILFAVLFGFTTAGHIFQGIRYKKPFTWVIVMACAWETAGFVFRTLWTHHSDRNTYVLPEQLLLVLAPLWVNAFDYMVLGRMMHFFLPQKKILGIPARRITLYFVLFDVVAFLIQGAGAAAVAGNGSKSTRDTGKVILVAGLGFQEAFFIFFIVIASQFHRFVLVVNKQAQREWGPLLYTLYASLVCITARTIYRMVEFSQPLDGSINHSEAYFYALEALPIFISVVLFNVWHPGKVLVGPRSDFKSDPAQSVRMERILVDEEQVRR